MYIIPLGSSCCAQGPGTADDEFLGERGSRVRAGGGPAQLRLHAEVRIHVALQPACLDPFVLLNSAVDLSCCAGNAFWDSGSLVRGPGCLGSRRVVADVLRRYCCACAFEQPAGSGGYLCEGAISSPFPCSRPSYL